VTIKISAFFQATDPVAGWSETLYFSGTDLGAASDYMVLYWPLRLAVAPADVSVLGGRANVIGTRKRSKLISKPVADSGTFNGETDSTEPWSALQIAWDVNFDLHTVRFMHGIPQSQVVAGIYTPTGGFTTALTALLTSLEANTKMWARDPSVVGSPKQQWTPTDIHPEKMTSHRVGRPFGLLVGRRLS
jgi:hypothetical protein